MIRRRTVLLVILWSAVIPHPGWAADPPTVRILTYNIHHGEGNDGRLDLERIGALIQRLAPDVVALQEVDVETTRSRGVDQAARLGELTGMHVAFGKAMDYAGGRYGEAILSRQPLADVQTLALPFVSGCEPRAVLSARIRLAPNGLEFVFFATHLEHANVELRQLQAQALTTLPGIATGQPAILAGDLNAVPGSPAMQAVLEHWSDATADRPEPTCPSDQPKVKIDYVLFRPASGWRVAEAKVVDERVASDHRPLLVVLERVPASTASPEPAR